MKKYLGPTILLILGIIIFLGGRVTALNNDSESIILTWSSSSFAPAWYPGKPLPSSGSQIIVSASPEILLHRTKLKPQNLIYRWFLNYRLQTAASGQGQQDFSFIASGSKGTELNVKVEIYNNSGDIFLGQRAVKITLSEPTVQIHTLNPSQSPGPALKNNLDISPGQTISLMAVPYFFNITNISQINFNWTVNDEPLLDLPERPDILEIKTDPKTPFGTVYSVIGQLKSEITKEFASSPLIITVK